MKVALVSLAQAWEDKNNNKELCIKSIEEALQYGAQLVIFPELTLTGFSHAVNKIGEDYQNSPTLNWFSHQAQVYKLAIIGGFMGLHDNGNIINKGENSAFFFDEHGSLLTLYKKIHPFSFSGEHNYVHGGTHLGVCTYKGICFGLSICYDLRFGPLYRVLSHVCDVAVVIANWPSVRSLHWEVLLQARAIEHQMYILGINRSGTDPKMGMYDGNSLGFLPTGNLLQPLVSTQTIQILEIDRDIVEAERRTFPVRQDWREDIYEKIEKEILR